MFLTVGIKAIIGKLVCARTARGRGVFAREYLNVAVCNNCGLPGHIAAECSSKTMCWNCKEPGHLASQCSNDPICKQGIWHVHVYNRVTQELATIALNQGTLLRTAPMEKHVTIAERQGTLLVNALMSQSAVSVMYQATWHVNAPKQLLHHK